MTTYVFGFQLKGAKGTIVLDIVSSCVGSPQVAPDASKSKSSSKGKTEVPKDSDAPLANLYSMPDLGGGCLAPLVE